MITTNEIFWFAAVVSWLVFYVLISEALWEKTDPSFRAIEFSSLPSCILGAAGGFVITALAVLLFWATGLMGKWDIRFFWK
jgi:hypothetical protein